MRIIRDQNYQNIILNYASQAGRWSRNSTSPYVDALQQTVSLDETNIRLCDNDLLSMTQRKKTSLGTRVIVLRQEKKWQGYAHVCVT